MELNDKPDPVFQAAFLPTHRGLNTVAKEFTSIQRDYFHPVIK